MIIDYTREDLMKLGLKMCFPMSFVMFLFGLLDNLGFIIIGLLFVPAVYGIGFVIVEGIYEKLEV